jgi:pimeloyl-ACP methyl ester carboxylesterase
MKKLIAGGLLFAAAALPFAAQAQTAKPTVVLVHGAFADSSSWNGVVRIGQSAPRGSRRCRCGARVGRKHPGSGRARRP